MRPELARDLELLGNVDGAFDVDRAIGHFGGVVQFGKAGVAGTRIVPAIGAFQCHAVQTFEELDVPVRLQFLQVGGQGDAHDAGADPHHVDGLVVAGGGHRTLGQRPVQEQRGGQQQQREQGEQGLAKFLHGGGIVGGGEEFRMRRGQGKGVKKQRFAASWRRF
ncbi:hypothetical protein G6F40_013854 [Rhizopus arrhizus]|nr:hypothetical protein G6F40_013854 [Rhizopus arrhizus]